jgi:hypothetical protein
MNEQPLPIRQAFNALPSKPVISLPTLYRWLKTDPNNAPAHSRIGHRIYVTPKALADWIMANELRT